MTKRQVSSLSDFSSIIAEAGQKHRKEIEESKAKFIALVAELSHLQPPVNTQSDSLYLAISLLAREINP